MMLGEMLMMETVSCRFGCQCQACVSHHSCNVCMSTHVMYMATCHRHTQTEEKEMPAVTLADWASEQQPRCTISVQGETWHGATHVSTNSGGCVVEITQQCSSCNAPYVMSRLMYRHTHGIDQLVGSAQQHTDCLYTCTDTDTLTH